MQAPLLPGHTVRGFGPQNPQTLGGSGELSVLQRLTSTLPGFHVRSCCAVQPAVYRREGFPCVLGTRAAQRFRSVDGVHNRRGNVLGGGSSVNAGFYR